MSTASLPLIARAPALVLIAFTALAYAVISLAVSLGHTPGALYHTPAFVLAIHLATVVPAVPLGSFVLWCSKGDARHKMLGRIWGILMMVTSIDSFWVREPSGSLGPIHIFSALTLVSIPLAIYHARTGNIRAHRRVMTSTYIGLCLAGLFAMVPGRLVGTMLFG